ncbi:TPA: cupin domain-containing protein [Neisseria gonorrhoeae]
MGIHLDFSISPKTFRQTYLYQKPKLFKGAVRNLEAASCKYINEIYQRADPTAPLFHLRKKGAIVPKEEYVESFDDLGKTRYRFIKSVIYEHMKNGASLVYNHINNEPFSDHIARQVARFAGAHTIVSGYLAFGSDESYKNHWDARDMYAVQLFGKKRWQLTAPDFPMPLYMQQTKDTDISIPEHIDMDIILEAGDVLYIPRGWWHRPIPLGCETFHFAVGTFPPNGYNYLEWLMKKFPTIESLRHSFSDWEQDRTRINDTAAQIAAMIADPVNYEAFSEDFLGKERTDTAFHLEQFANPNATPLSDDVRLRLNANNLDTLEKGYLIGNGMKISVDELGKKVLEHIGKNEPLLLKNLLVNFNQAKHEEVRKLIYQLIELDFLEIL